MYCTLRNHLTYLFIAIGILVGATSYVNAQTPMTSVEEKLFQENVENFKKWRKNIPDYEKRLYDRVKSVNSRVLRVQRLVVASLILFIVINYFLYIYLYRKLQHQAFSSSLPPASTRPSGIARFFLVLIPSFLKGLLFRLSGGPFKLSLAPATCISDEQHQSPSWSWSSFRGDLIRHFRSDDFSFTREMPLFLFWLVIFTAISFLLITFKPYQLISAIDQFHYYQQVISQNANGNPVFGLGSNYLIYGGIDFAVNGHLLPAFFLASFFDDVMAQIVTFTILSIELFVTLYICCRLFRLPVYVSMIAAWLAPLFFIPYVHPPLVLVEPFLVTPFLSTLACISILTTTFFYRLGKSDLRSNLIFSAGLFLTASYIILALLYFSVVYLYAVIWPCLGIFFFASTIRERMIKATATILLGALFYLVFYDYLSAFYQNAWGFLVPGQEAGAKNLLTTVLNTFKTAFSSFEGFFKVFTLKVFPMWSNQRQEFSFTTIFFYGSFLSATSIVLLFVDKFRSNIFQISITFLFSTLSIISWNFGNFEASIAPLFLSSFVIGVTALSFFLNSVLVPWVKKTTLFPTGLENGFEFSWTFENRNFSIDRLNINIRTALLISLTGLLIIFFEYRLGFTPSKRMQYEYGVRPDLEAYTILEKEIGINHSPVFRGRLAGMAYIDDANHYIIDPNDPNKKQKLRDILNLRRIAESAIAYKHGGDFTRTVIQDRIPFLHDNNRFTSPGVAMIERYFLSRPEDRLFVQNHNISKYDNRLLEMIGVRFILRSEPLSTHTKAALRNKFRFNDLLTLYLYELPDPNIGNYSPTEQVIFRSAKQAMDIIGNRDIDFRKTVLVEKAIPEPLVPVLSSKIEIRDNGLSVEATSQGKSLVVLPFEYGNCTTIRNQPGTNGPTPELIRVNLDQIGVIFENRADVYLTSHFHPFNTDCRKQDMQDWKRLKISELKTYNGEKWTGGYEIK